MSADETLGLAQILLGLLLFTVGIPALIIEQAEEPLRPLLRRRIRLKPMITLGGVTLLIVAFLIIVTGDKAGKFEEWFLKAVVILLICGFVYAWIKTYENVSIALVIREISNDMKAWLQQEESLKDSDLADLITFGEHLEGEEKSAVIDAIGSLCARVQELPGYNGTQLQELLRGLQRVVVHDGTTEHHRSALAIITRRWETLTRLQLMDQDSKVLKDVASVLGSIAVSEHLGSMPLRWMSSIPRVVEVPYAIGTAAIHAGDYTVAIEALSRLSWIVENENVLSKEFIALAAYLHGSGPSAATTAQGFIDQLGYSRSDLCAAARKAATEFRDSTDYATADVIGTFLRAYNCGSQPPIES